MPLNNKTTHPVPEGQPDRGLARSTSGVWTSGFNALAVRCVPEGQRESRPAIYRRYWCLEIDLVPEGRSKLGLAIADTIGGVADHVHLLLSLSTTMSVAKAMRYSGVPPGRGPCGPEPGDKIAGLLSNVPPRHQALCARLRSRLPYGTFSNPFWLAFGWR
jgi:hypothetical protein